jgi:predicted phage baseplate assembly protein
MGDDGHGHIRFGDGELGRSPVAGMRVRAAYRIGNGPAGNVGRDTITYLVVREGTLSTDEVKPRNPLPAQGGTAPEATAEAKLVAPNAFRSRRMRAITAEDYAELAQQNAKLQRAACDLRWTGSWYEARVSVDPRDTAAPGRKLLAEIKAHLFPYRRMGHDLAITAARYVPLDVALEICVLPTFTRGHVKAALLEVFGARRLVDGRTGFFHPDHLSFGDGIHLSRLVAAAKSVEGVATVKVRRLGRLHAFDDDALASGVLEFDSMEIAQLESDPNFPENGQLQLIMRGGR